MGFDNECILNIQSLAGEYFCPVCRLLVYPNEALQSQCTHLYCKPCLTYIVGTTRACPYDGYLVTEADSKPLIESNKTLADTIGKIAVHCLYHRSGCPWQGQLSECITHCTGCTFGNSPVVCNRCGTQIVHRQVQEHAQNCPGVQPQAQQAEGSQDATTATGSTATSEQNQATTQAGPPASQAQVSQIAPTSGHDQSQVNPNSQPQAAVQAIPTPEQWYQQQQQYQQYYQQYPGYDPYQQQYQQYGSYQQQAYQQYPQQPPPQAIPGQQPQMYMQPQAQAQLPVRPQIQPQTQPQAQPQPQSQPQSQLQPQPHLQSQAQAQTQAQPPTHAHPQAQVGVQPQVQAQVNAPNQLPPSHPQMQPQTYAQQPQVYSQAQPHLQPHPPQPQVQPHLQQRPLVPQHQQSHPQHPQLHQQTHPYSQPQSIAQTQLQPQSQVQHLTPPQMQPQPHTHTQTQPQPRPQSQPQHPSSHAVTGHQSYPQPQPNQQVPPRQLPQQTVQMQAQFPQQQLAQLRPPHSHIPMQQQQQPAMLPPQGQRPSVPPAQQHVHPQAHQPIHQYPGMHPPHQQNVAQQQAHGHSLHAQAFPGQTPGSTQNTPHQPAPFIQQQPMQPQLRPQVPPSTLPPASHAQQQLQHNVPISHGLQSHQSHNYAGRPMLPNHGMPHQSFQPSSVGPAGSAHPKLQSGGIQQYPSRSNIRPQSSAEQQLGYMHQAVPPQSGNETLPYPASAAPLSGTKNQVSSVQPTMKSEPQAEAVSQLAYSKEANVLPAAPSQGARLVESRLAGSENELIPESEMKFVDGDNKSANEGEGRSSHPKPDVKEISESSQALEKNPLSSSQQGLDDPVVKNMVKEDTTAKSESPGSDDDILAETAVRNQEGSPHIVPNKDESSQPVDKEVQDDVQKNVSSQQTDILHRSAKVPNNTVDSQGKVTTQGKILKSERNNMEAFALHERNMLQSQSSRQDSSFVQPGHMQGRVHQRPPVPDQMSSQNLHQMQVPGPPPLHMRPQGHNIPGNFPQQGQSSIAPSHFQQPIAKQPHGPFHSEASPGGVFGPGSSASFGRGPGPFGPQGHLNIGKMPPHLAGGGGPRIQGDPMGGPAFNGPPPGAFDSHGMNMGRVPPHGQQIPANPMDPDFLVNRRTGFFDGRQPDLHLPGSADRVPFGQPSNMQSDIMKPNGGSVRAVSGGLSDPSYPFGMEERFKRFPEERYRQLPEEGFNLPGEEHISGFPVESGRRIINRRELFDDLKHFPRPSHLDPEHVPKPESYFSSSRPIDRTPHGFTSDARLKLDGTTSVAASRLLPPYQTGGLRPNDLRDDNTGRKVDHVGIHPDFHRPASESGRHPMDGLPPLRSPGREYSDIPPSRFGRIEDSDGRESRTFGERSRPFNLHSDSNPFLERRFPILPPHLRRGELDVPGNLRIGERGHLRGGDLVGPDILPSHLRGGGPVGPGGYGAYPNPLRLGDGGGPGNLPLNLRIGESLGGNLPSHSRAGFSSGMPIHGYASDAGFFNAGEVESLDHSRKRKHGSMGWCRICKVDCGTVEGLEMHSQTREHQKMAMDMVLNIKKDNAKKQKISSDDHISHESDTNKTMKTN